MVGLLAGSTKFIEQTLVINDKICGDSESCLRIFVQASPENIPLVSSPVERMGLNTILWFWLVCKHRCPLLREHMYL